MGGDGHRIHVHTWHHAISRREFLGATATAAGALATSSLWFPAVALGGAEGSRSPDVLPMTPRPVRIAGGDVLGPSPGFQIYQFAPGDTTFGLDGPDAELNGITNFRGLAMMGYTTGSATGSDGKTYASITDNRVYHGEYVAVDGRHAHGTFVEI
jgi:hypothetical protein